MPWRVRRRGFFEGPLRGVYRRSPLRYVRGAAPAGVLNGILVSGFGVITVVLYVDAHPGELAVFAACSAAVYVVEGLVAGAGLHRSAEPVRAWLAGERGQEGALEAWAAAAALPQAVLRRPSLYAIGALG